MAKIKNIFAYETLNSVGLPTLAGYLELDNNLSVTTSLPSGTSVSKNESYQLKDGDQNYFDGAGVFKAIYYINNLIAPKLKGVSVEKQIEIDNWLIKADGSKKKEILGANTILLVSQLIVKAAALNASLNLFSYLNILYERVTKNKIIIKKIPIPIFNLISGGVHGQNNLNFQEYLIIPSSANSFSNSLTLAAIVFYNLKKILEQHNVNVCYSFNRTYSPNLLNNIDPLELITETIIKKQYKIGIDLFLGIDFAADFYYRYNFYQIKDFQYQLNSEKYFDFIIKIIKKYQLFYLEDPFASNSWIFWKKLYEQFSKEIYIVGDDLISSNIDLLIKSIKENFCNLVVVKPTQVGTISETFQVIENIKKNNLSLVISQRSQETNDDLIVDLAVAVQADFIKFGPPAGGENLAKYNRLKQIEAFINLKK